MPAAGARGLRVTRAIAAGFDGRSEASLHPDLRTFVGDLVRPYGLPLREDLLTEGAGHDFGQMAEGLLGKALPAGEPADLLILAFSSPDVRPGAPAALHLSRHCPGQPTAFAVCDQGSAAAFTALRIAAAHHRTGGCLRAVIVLAEQSALHHEAPEPVDLPEQHRAVVLVCEESAGEGLRVRQQAQADGSAALRSVLADHRELGREATLLLAADLAAAPPTDLYDTPGAVGTARPGQPFTGVWTLLADRLAQRPESGGPLLVADHDRRLGRLSTLSLP
ncbi:hypothetical protein ACIRPK_07335 [Kitasatospora sp. NPDC101801]|uniref:hypothetical protein n=1 Tax=Kitasatospora sp. NPDC101801 TaxID=3364103 RepID=UPI00382F3C9B